MLYNVTFPTRARIHESPILALAAGVRQQDIQCRYDAELDCMYIVVSDANSTDAPNSSSDSVDVDADESSGTNMRAATASYASAVTSTSKTYVPMSSYKELHLRQLGRIQQRLGDRQIAGDNPGGDAISLALCDGSGVPIYYRVTGGFKEKHP